MTTAMTMSVSDRTRRASGSPKVIPKWCIRQSAVGTPLDGGNFLRSTHYPQMARAGLPRLRFHDMRHTAATLMLEQGVHPKVVAERLGHATVNVTLNVYSHVTPTMQREAAATLDRLLGGA
jgi:integrase